MQNLAILLATIALLGVLMWPRLSEAPLWRATVTPLASIIGSGFLVLGPILDDGYGLYAPIAMAALCLGAWVFGAAVRFNIAAIERAGGRRSRAEERVETLASWALAFAYVISVCYYLNLFGAFAVSLTPLKGPDHAREVTTAVFLVVLIAGWARGFGALERMEQVAVSLKLAIILGLLVGLAQYVAQHAVAGDLVLNDPGLSGWPAVTLAFGLIVTVQGFETARYLGETYDARTRIRAMRLAQALATLIYMVYICLLAFDFPAGEVALTETAIIDLMQLVAPILPVLLVAAALAAQFSAAVADTAGSGGLVAELTGGRISSRQSYVLLVAIGILLTWSADVFQIISYASRAFAAYYALQAVIAALAARGRPGTAWRGPAFVALALLGLAIVIFGTPVE
ncbi:amino acid permease [Pseudodonghicola flavimaris]|uniref:APC family permease n=1 Tax=Pseudodonghicola flavimaris TaxID=3050036 RepID=A0ABT7EYM5_9RHOB|nr:amino acid permease [Pseudodonghicola flavimaris]MDK3017442.1 hypothetical protein [Pseudodonghicola flavimaris]